MNEIKLKERELIKLTKDEVDRWNAYLRTIDQIAKHEVEREFGDGKGKISMNHFLGAQSLYYRILDDYEIKERAYEKCHRLRNLGYDVKIDTRNYSLTYYGTI